QVANIARGGYLVKVYPDAKLTFVATGSDVELAVKVANEFEKKGIKLNFASIRLVVVVATQAPESKTTVVIVEIAAG
ncbi:transketolase, partial [Francisella tularensis subsp. holarctica]|uniref:transketolase-like TK C-terminal-containing protein n=1 Tax=Francisella tularensis TaxID=263 RepID=UPI0023ADC478|nr:transketolase [Francisella tularensis subsp. holarctica]